ncbi:uncharacterized protein F5147DRAFT_816072 [Suillus discolor]|uniref:Nitrite/Sulfite reductase ferredoxin-like domain-containing protein n=1 Tax=Suillus discolor TaxID=1912936 RepID=A0A9P7EZS4_9AGAM|nr:uncharacterized protein F5147DRAFT_816072 [Suillus discolor]KAG2098229.1 hypothetical protein F5147DRAFT_816072 [Suillus discolor]
MSFESDIVLETELVPSTKESVEQWKWRGYPQNLFRNWVADRVARIYYVDVLESGKFKLARDTNPAIEVDESAISQLWDQLQIEPTGLHLRVLLVDNMKHPALQMLGTRYNIELCFFTSSLNWIPSQYQEEVVKKKGDPWPYTFNHNIDDFGWSMGDDGRRHTMLFIENGCIQDEPDCDFKTGLREIVKIHKGTFRLTANQHITVSEISMEDVPEMIYS